MFFLNFFCLYSVEYQALIVYLKILSVKNTLLGNFFTYIYIVYVVFALKGLAVRLA